MEITTEQLLAFLADQETTPVILSNRNSRIRNIRLFNERTRLVPGNLYIGYGSKLRNEYLDRNVNLVCIGPVDSTLLRNERINANILELPVGTSLEDVFNRLQGLFELDVQQSGTFQEDDLANMLVGKGLQNVLDIGQTILSNPIYLVHDEYILVAKSTRIAIPDIICQELLMRGRLTISEADKYFGERFLQRFSSFTKPTLIESASLPYNRILGKVEIPDGTYAAIAVVEYTRAFQEQDFKIVETLCKAIEQELSGSNRARSINEAKVATLVNDLVDGSIQDERHLKLRLESIDWQPPSAFKLYLVNAQMVSDTYLTFYRDLFSQQLPRDDVFIHVDSIVLLHETTADKSLTHGFEQTIAYLCEINDLRCGASGETRSLAKLVDSFRQANHVLQTAGRLQTPGCFFRHEDFMLLFLIEHLSLGAPLENYIHPIVTSINEYDLENGSDYGHTLYIYLLHAKDMLNTSRELFIHRNTLAYRLRRLSEMFDIDWSDGYLLTQLFISLEIARFVIRK